MIRDMQRGAGDNLGAGAFRRLVIVGVAAAAVLIMVAVAVFCAPWSSKVRLASVMNAKSPTVKHCEYSKVREESTSRIPGALPARTAPAPKGRVPKQGTVQAELYTSTGTIPVTLNRSGAPCNVAAIVALIKARYYNDTMCHRITSAPTLHILQCGDPTATGMGGPGFITLDDEYPENLHRASSSGAVIYPRGTVAVANAGPHTNGSQIFFTIKDSQLPPDYTVIGHVNTPGLAVLDAISSKGAVGGAQDGKPAKKVTIETAQVR